MSRIESAWRIPYGKKLLQDFEEVPSGEILRKIYPVKSHGELLLKKFLWESLVAILREQILAESN